MVTKRSIYDYKIIIIPPDASILITSEPFKYLIMNDELIIQHV